MSSKVQEQKLSAAGSCNDECSIERLKLSTCSNAGLLAQRKFVNESEEISNETVKMDTNVACNMQEMTVRSNISQVTNAQSRTPCDRNGLATRKYLGTRTDPNRENENSDNEDDVGYSDETDSAMKTVQYLDPFQAWAAFENTVKNVDSANPEYFTKMPKRTFVSSGTFQEVMVDMYGNTEYGNTKGYTVLKMKLNNMARASGLASRMINTAIAKGKEEREHEEEVGQPEVDVNDVSDTQESFAHENVRRGWRLVKREVNEQVMENKTQSVKLNLTMLQHTVKQMGNTERTRQDLYERYGILPTKLSDGRIVCENIMLSERARAQINAEFKESEIPDQDDKRPSTCQPTSMHARSRSRQSIHKNRCDELNKGTSAKVSTRKARPKTAK